MLCGDKPNAVLSFNVKGIHHEDLSMFLDEYGIATRPGQHCAMLFHKKFGLTGSVRVSLGVYNNKEEMDFFVDSLNEIKRKLSK